MSSEASLMDPINSGSTYKGLEYIEHPPKLVEFVDVAAYLKELDERMAADKKAEEERRIKMENEGWAVYDQVKPTDYIENPYHYDTPYALTPYERDLVERTVMHEAGWCLDYRLLVLTAQCFRNACEIHNWTPSEVYSKCGYAAMGYANPRARKAVADVFDTGIKCVEEPIHSYYNSTMVSSSYHEQFNLAIDIDGNRFFY